MERKQERHQTKSIRCIVKLGLSFLFFFVLVLPCFLFWVPSSSQFLCSRDKFSIPCDIRYASIKSLILLCSMDQTKKYVFCCKGGAAITCKNEFEKINEENLDIVSSQLRQAMISGRSPSTKGPGMDWSKRHGESEVFWTENDFGEDAFTDSSSFVVVHGAGSFGHFQASKSGVHIGGLGQPLVKAGFVATRISVTSLNLEIVRALAREGIPSVGMSPFTCGWSTSEKNLASADSSMVAKAINSGFIPVLHGDAVLDELQGSSILSGDVIIRHLAAQLKPEFVVFLTDVLGVYDRPPVDPTAVLLREIAVREDGSWDVVKPVLQGMNKVETTVAAHDTTGGMMTKITEAAMIARLGIDVYIVKAATSYSLRALSGELRGNIPDDWSGTVIRFVS